MDIKVIIEIIGYVGSALVLVSMLMTSVVKLRIINLTGSVIFAGYALAIRSYPTAIMNICLAGINIFHLVRIFREEKAYSLIRTDISDGYFSHIVNSRLEDIVHWFPEFSLEGIKADVSYLVCCDDSPACLFIAEEVRPGELEVLLDYAMPAYRDTSVGRFFHNNIGREGFKSLTFRQKALDHIPYLEKMGYKVNEDKAYVLNLSGKAH